ncbi:MAG: cyclic nucleotide-binding domain-containing protein [Cellvibrionaceae bacterium]
MEKQPCLDIDAAKTLAPLNVMGQAHLEELLMNSSVMPLFAGQTLFRQGDVDHQYLYLLYGELEIKYPDGTTRILEGSQSRLPIAPQQPRNCTVKALGDCSVLHIDSNRLNKLLSWSQIADYMAVEMAYDPNRDEDAAWIDTVLHSNLFYKVPPTNIGCLLSRMKPMVVDAGEVILRQGEIGDGCYFIKEGEAKVTRAEAPNQPSELLAIIDHGRCFGEDALIQETVRNATVTMLNAGVLMFMDKKDFVELLKEPGVPGLNGAELMGVVSQGATLIDVRTQDEYEAGCLEGALNFPLHLLRSKQRMLEKDIHYVIYCDSGRRSQAAVYLLREQGYNVTWLSGGMQELSAALLKTWFKVGGDEQSTAMAHSFL